MHLTLVTCLSPVGDSGIPSSYYYFSSAATLMHGLDSDPHKGRREYDATIQQFITSSSTAVASPAIPLLPRPT
jgi:hypothetical protein